MVSQRAQDFQRLGVINTVFASNKKYRKIPKISLSSQARNVKKTLLYIVPPNISPLPGGLYLEILL